MEAKKYIAQYELKAPRKPANSEMEYEEVGETRNRARLLYPLESLAHMSPEELLTVQRILHHGDVFGLWETKPEWLPPGSKNLKIDLRSRIINLLPAPTDACNDTAVQSTVESAVLTLVRYLCLLRIGPSGKGRDSFRALSPSSVRYIAYCYGAPLMALAVAKRIAAISAANISAASSVENGAKGLLSALTLDDFSTLTPNAHRKVLHECRRMEMLGQHGLWWDMPALVGNSLTKAITGPQKHNNTPQARRSYLPLPDEYVADLGYRGLWLIYDLAPNLLRICASLVEVWEQTNKPHLAGITIRDGRAYFVRDILETFDWRDRDGNSFSEPPFPIVLPKVHGFGVRDEDQEGVGIPRWPPRNYRDLKGLLGAVQTAHMCVGLLSMGPRRSEILSLERTCVSYAVDGRTYANGKTYKLVQRHDGEVRDWLLPEVAIDAFEQQARLVTLCEKISFIDPKRNRARSATDQQTSNHLWGRISSCGESDATIPLNDTNQALVSYARMLRMDSNPGGQKLTSHRFRKTLARLVALALTQAPRILMQIFGHRSIEMTLYYILADKDLHTDIETVARELRVMRAEDVIENMVNADIAGTETYAGYGGPAASTIHRAIELRQEQVHRRGDTWEMADVTELAELLTLQGKAWEQVRTGVICTKFAGEAGPCNKSKGRQEPSKCQSHCIHRLEESLLAKDLDGVIYDSIKAYEQAIADKESLTAAHWAGQIRAHVPRFAALKDKWMSHPIVSALIVNIDTPDVA